MQTADLATTAKVKRSRGIAVNGKTGRISAASNSPIHETCKSLRLFIEQAKLEFSDIYFCANDGTGRYCAFDIKPDEFITFAKADFYSPDTRGLVNALSNAKRAIDCATDGFIDSIGLHPDTLEKQLGRTGVDSLAFGKILSQGSLKFRFLEALGIATPSILSRMRKLRHMLEHEYKKPSRRAVGDAIGIAELFVQACTGKMCSLYDGFSFGSGISTKRDEKEIAREFYIKYECAQSPSFEIIYWNREKPRKPGVPAPGMRVELGEPGFVPLLKLTWHTDLNKDMTEPLKAFLLELGFRLPSRFKVREGHGL